MKKAYLISFLSVALALFLVSWGTTGHFSIWLIARQHLTPEAKKAVDCLLDNGPTEQASTWADDVRGQSTYIHTGPEHYINLPPGLSFTAFAQAVEAVKEDNVYKAVLKYEQDLRSPYTTKNEKSEALKFLIHFIADLHQPMHVSRAEDEGGNKIPVRYNGNHTNLHAVWDSWLLENDHLNYKEVAKEYNTASPEQVRKWQNDGLVKWLWESYRLSTNIYGDIESMKNDSLGHLYYTKHIPIVRERVEIAGIRLAGVLNRIFNDTNIIPPCYTASYHEDVKFVNIDDISKNFGNYVRVCSKIHSHKNISDIILLNMGNDSLENTLTIVLKGAARDVFKNTDGKQACVTGRIIDYYGKPEIIIYEPEKLVLH